MCGAVSGQTLVGPSTAVLNESRFGLSAEYSQADVDVTYTDGSKADFDFQTAYAGFAAALTSRWDFFVRLGGSQAEANDAGGDWNLSWGMGTRLTAFRWHDFSWGVLAQFTNLISEHDTVSLFDVSGTPTLLPATEKLSLVEYVFATGPTWQHGPLLLYGGPLLRYADGELEARAIASDVHGQLDVDPKWDIGGYFGGRVSLFQADPSRACGINRCDLTAEGRFTGDSTGFSVGLLLPFGGVD
jgi:hypothetical protein